MRKIFYTAVFFMMLGLAPVVSAATNYDEYDAIEQGASTHESDGGIRDPLEPFNRAVFKFNNFLDTILIKPITTVYTTISPGFVQQGVTSFLTNLGEPIVLLNTALQGDWDGFGKTFKRFAFNTTWGVAGVYDFAGNRGLEPVRADFGQTLGKWGLGHGFYLVLPVFGPSSLRDGSGRVVDSLADPYNLYFSAHDPEWPIYARAGLAVVDARARFGPDFERVMQNAVDPYTTFRSIYVQRRAYVVQHKNMDPYIAADTK